MKVVYSYSSGFFKSKTDYKSFYNVYGDEQFKGFYNKEMFFNSFVLSVFSAANKFQEIELYTDPEGYELLNFLDLPFTCIYKDINVELTENEKKFWAISKIKTHLRQKEPYFHMDYDLFLFNNLPSNMLKSPIFGYMKEYDDFNWYNKDVSDFINNGNFELLPELKTFIERYPNTIPSINCGVIGGNNIEFLHEYCMDVLKYINCMSPDLLHVYRCTFLEQFYLGAKAKIKNIKLLTLSDFYGKMINEKSGTLHLFGPGFKLNKNYVDWLSYEIQDEYPEIKKKIKEVIQ